MSLSDLASLGSFVSGVAVLVSLIYLALQVRQAQRNQRAAIHQSRLDSRIHLLETIAGNPPADLINRGYLADPTMTALEGDQFVYVIGTDFLQYEEWFYQFCDGMIDRRRWESSLRALRYEATFPGFRAAWRSLRPAFQDDFGRVVDEVFQQTPLTGASHLAPQWRAQAAQERARVSNLHREERS
jgi:hypothetical protein